MYKRYDYEYIEAYEGNLKTFSFLKKHIFQLGVQNVNLYNEFIGYENDKETNFDGRYSNKTVSLINMDIEGAETSVLRGAKKIIAEQEPILAVCAYHKPSDIVEIPNIVLHANRSYSVYLRKYPSSTPRRITEYAYYFVPQNRRID